MCHVYNICALFRTLISSIVLLPSGCGVLCYTLNDQLFLQLHYLAQTECSFSQCFSTVGPWPGTGPWHKLYRAVRGSPGICHFSFLSRVLLEKLTGLQLVKKFPAFHGTRRFITALTSVLHLSLSWASPIQSIYTHPTSWRSVLILSTHLCLGLPSGLLPSGFPTKTLYTPFSSPIHTTCPAHLVLLHFITRTTLGEQYKSFSSSLCSLLHSPVTSSLLGPNILKVIWIPWWKQKLSFVPIRQFLDSVHWSWGPWRGSEMQHNSQFH